MSVAIAPAPAPAPAEAADAVWWEPPQGELVRRALARRLNVLLVGPTGCGKTTLLERALAELDGEPPAALNLHGELSVDELFGARELRGGETVFRPGPALQAMLDRAPLVLHELDAATPEVLFCLQRVLERKDVVVPAVAGPDGRPLRLDPWRGRDGAASRFVVAATANTLGRGDGGGLYRGTRVLNEAFLDRFDLVVRLDYPPPRAEAALLVARAGVHPDDAAAIVRVAGLARRAAASERLLATTFSVRKALAWATARAHLGLDLGAAFAATCLDRAPDEDREVLAELYQRATGRR
ncbi:MAG: MoxR family ATPase [Planctomycetes bacterium]|nr:MoxR family ATPase [Planctomycetota bacterium]